MQPLEVSVAVRPIYGSLGVKRLRTVTYSRKAVPWLMEGQSPASHRGRPGSMPR